MIILEAPNFLIVGPDKRLAEQLETLNQQQLEHLLQRKQQLLEQRARPKAERPDRSP